MNLSRHSLWIWVIAAFVLLIAAWALLIAIASRHAPETVPLESSPPPAAAAPEDA